MTTTMILSTVLIILALVFYTVGVWAERLAGRLKPWHTVCFWLGLAFDTAGTTLMIEFAGGLTADLHGLTGVTAILLMIIHAVWATAVLVRKDERAIRNFHRFSVVVWAIWLIPFLSGIILPMAG